MRKLIKTYPDIFFNITRKARRRWYIDVIGDNKTYQTFFRNITILNLRHFHDEMLTK